jgi:hypothetical protein
MSAHRDMSMSDALSIVAGIAEQNPLVLVRLANMNRRALQGLVLRLAMIVAADHTSESCRDLARRLDTATKTR